MMSTASEPATCVGLGPTRMLTRRGSGFIAGVVRRGPGALELRDDDGDDLQAPGCTFHDHQIGSDRESGRCHVNLSPSGLRQHRCAGDFVAQGFGHDVVVSRDEVCRAVDRHAQAGTGDRDRQRVAHHGRDGLAISRRDGSLQFGEKGLERGVGGRRLCQSGRHRGGKSDRQRERPHSGNVKINQQSHNLPICESTNGETKKPAAFSHSGLFVSVILPAATYSPIEFPLQYHRRYQA